MSYAHRAKRKARRRARPREPMPVMGDAPLTEFERRRLANLAGLIQDEAHLEAILASAEPLYREGIRCVLLPYLTFTPQAVAN